MLSRIVALKGEMNTLPAFGSTRSVSRSFNPKPADASVSFIDTCCTGTSGGSLPHAGSSTAASTNATVTRRMSHMTVRTAGR